MLWFSKSRRAQNDQDYETWTEGGVVPTLNAFDNGDIRSTTAIVFHPHRFDGVRLQGETINTLTAFMGTGGNNVSMVSTSHVRRLTPVECERLQGFPDGWTEGQSITNRYKQMGNAITVNVAEWVFGRISATL